MYDIKTPQQRTVQVKYLELAIAKTYQYLYRKKNTSSETCPGRRQDQRKQKTERANTPRTLLMLGHDEYHEKHTS